MPFDVLNIAIIVSSGYGVLQLALLFTTKSKLQLKVPLGILLVVLVWIQVEFLMVRNLWDFPLDRIFGTRYGSWLFLGPSLFGYLKSSLGDPVDLKSYLLQLIPGFVLVMIFPSLLPEVISERAINYGMLTVLGYSHMGFTPWQGFYGFVFMAQFVHLFVYLVISARMIYRTEHDLKKVDAKPASIGWMKVPIWLMAAVIIGSTYFFYLLLTSYRYYRYWDFFYVIPFSLMTYFIVYKINRNPQLIRTDLKLISNGGAKYQRSTIDPSLLDNYAERLRRIMEEKKLYLNPGLTLKILSEELDISQHHLSQVFSQSLKSTFFDYINAMRVEEAKRLLTENHHKVIEVAMMSGFSTKASFNKYFKQLNGMTPTEYVEKIK